MVLQAQGLGSSLRQHKNTGGYEYLDNASTGETLYHEWIMEAYCLCVCVSCSNALCSNPYTQVLHITIPNNHAPPIPVQVAKKKGKYPKKGRPFESYSWGCYAVVTAASAPGKHWVEKYTHVPAIHCSRVLRAANAVLVFQHIVGT